MEMKTCESIRTIRHAPSGIPNRIDEPASAKRAEPLAGALAGRLEITHAFRTERSLGSVTDAQLEACARRLVDRAHHQSTGRPLDYAPARFASLRLVHLQRVTVAAVLS